MHHDYENMKVFLKIHKGKKKEFFSSYKIDHVRV